MCGIFSLIFLLWPCLTFLAGKLLPLLQSFPQRPTMWSHSRDPFRVQLDGLAVQSSLQRPTGQLVLQRLPCLQASEMAFIRLLPMLLLHPLSLKKRWAFCFLTCPRSCPNASSCLDPCQCLNRCLSPCPYLNLCLCQCLYLIYPCIHVHPYDCLHVHAYVHDWTWAHIRVFAGVYAWVPSTANFLPCPSSGLCPSLGLRPPPYQARR